MELKLLLGPKTFAFLLVLPVFVSGCIIPGPGNGGTSGGPGIIIKTFEPDISQIDSGDEVRLRFNIQNVGIKEARGVTAELAGLDPTEWLPSQETIFLGNLVGVDPEFNPNGGEMDGEFVVIAPPLPQGQPITFTPRLRIHYGYTTTATKIINVVNENEMRRLEQEGKTLPSGTTEVSGGPLSVSITTGNIIRAGETTRRIVPISIIIRNTGGGSLVPNIGSPTPGITDNDLVFAELLMPSGLNIISTGSEDCQKIIGGGTIRLFRGRDKTITCQMEITEIPLSTTTKTITLILNYDYMVETTTNINVRGTGL